MKITPQVIPQDQQYYDAKDISIILGIGKNHAYEILHMFEVNGKLFRHNKTMRVRQKVFDQWLIEQESHELVNGRPV